jgi:predicted RNA-binding Zn ribbon-like protein
MRTSEENIALIFQFIAEDVEIMARDKPGSFKDLQKELAGFAGIPARDLTLDVLVRLREILIHHLLWGIARHNYRKTASRVREEPKPYAFPNEDAPTVHWHYRQGHFSPLLVQGATVDIAPPANKFLWSVCVSLSQIDAERVRICERDECGKYFFADHANMIFCGQRCGNLDRLKRSRHPETAHQPAQQLTKQAQKPARAQAGGQQAAVA